MNQRLRLIQAEELDAARESLWSLLSLAPSRTALLRYAIANGKINGYRFLPDANCSCFAGYVLSLEAYYRHGPIIRDAERFCLKILSGDTPSTNPYSALALRWVDQWIHRNFNSEKFHWEHTKARYIWRCVETGKFHFQNETEQIDATPFETVEEADTACTEYAKCI